jgi:hypothetical protein
MLFSPPHPSSPPTTPAPTVVLGAVDAHLASPAVCKFALATLVNLTHSPAGARDAAGLPGLPGVVVAATGAHTHDAEVQQYGCALLAHLCEAEYGFARAVVSSPTLLRVVEALRLFPDSRAVQREGLRVLVRGCVGAACASCVDVWAVGCGMWAVGCGLRAVCACVAHSCV